MAGLRGQSAIRAARVRAATPARLATANRLGLTANRADFNANRLGLNSWNNLGGRGRPDAWAGWNGRNSLWNRYGNVWNRPGYRFWRPYYRPFVGLGWYRWNNWGWNRWGWWPWWRLLPGVRFWPYYGFGGGYGYASSYYGYPTYSYQTVCPDPVYYNQYPQSGYTPAYDPNQAPADTLPAAPAETSAADAAATTWDANRFADEGEALFRDGRYGDAAQAFRHALVEDPQNGVLVQLLAQALFAAGAYDEAAGAVQQSLMMLPQEQWGVVPANARELYNSRASYHDQLTALEKAVSGSDAKPAERFLLAYQLGFSGQTKAALAQLAEVRKAAPEDQAAERLAEIWSTDSAPATPAGRGELPSPRPRPSIRSAGDL